MGGGEGGGGGIILPSDSTSGMEPVVEPERGRLYSLGINNKTHQFELSTTSPKPGVSTTVSSKCTPPSWMDTVDDLTCNR